MPLTAVPLTAVLVKLLGLSQAIHAWKTSLVALQADRREKIARYADAIAATLGRASAAFLALERDPVDPAAAREAARELGRIAGYVEDIVAALEHQFDGRKLAGVRRRLERLAEPLPTSQPAATPPAAQSARSHLNGRRLDQLAEAEGYFRALADGLRA